MAFRLERSTKEIASQYELTLTKPLGIEVQGESDATEDVL
jgi:hypothetical protein